MMKPLLTKSLLIACFLSFPLASYARDLSTVPDVRKVDLYKFNEDEYHSGRRPEHCSFSGQKQDSDPACFDGVLSSNEAHGYYAKEHYRLGKPLTANNKAKENTAGLDKISKEIASIYGGTQKAILEQKPNLNRVTAGLFNTLNDAITDIEPYVLSIANGNYDRNTLEKLDTFMNVFQNAWNKSVSSMVQYKGITQEKADSSTAYYRQELKKIRPIITNLNKYYQ